MLAIITELCQSRYDIDHEENSVARGLARGGTVPFRNATPRHPAFISPPIAFAENARFVIDHGKRLPVFLFPARYDFLVKADRCRDTGLFHEPTPLLSFRVQSRIDLLISFNCSNNFFHTRTRVCHAWCVSITTGFRLTFSSLIFRNSLPSRTAGRFISLGIPFPSSWIEFSVNMYILRWYRKIEPGKLGFRTYRCIFDNDLVRSSSPSIIIRGYFCIECAIPRKKEKGRDVEEGLCEKFAVHASLRGRHPCLSSR